MRLPGSVLARTAVFTCVLAVSAAVNLVATDSQAMASTSSDVPSGQSGTRDDVEEIASFASQPGPSVPETGALLMLGVALVSLARLARRRGAAPVPGSAEGPGA